MEWGPSVDSFSVGCVLAELVSGRSLFAPSFDTVERIAAIEVVIGLFPQGIVETVRARNQSLFTKGRPARAKFPPMYICDDCTVTSEAVVRIASLSHVSVRFRHALRLSANILLDDRQTSRHEQSRPTFTSLGSQTSDDYAGCCFSQLFC